MRETGRSFVSSAELEIVKDIKEKHCYVAEDYDAELKLYQNDSNKEVEYTLPDGVDIKIGS